MKHRQRITGFLSGVLVTALLMGSVLPAVAEGLSIFVDSGVKVYVNDAPIDAGDTHGNPEAFIYNGTTYVAVAAVSKSLGQDVKWDGNTKSVYIGKHEGSVSYLMDICPPYQTSDGQYYREPDTIQMGGKVYVNSFSMQDSSFALFNLNGQYDSLTFTLGHIDDSEMIDGVFYIYLDNELVERIEVGCEALPKVYTIPLNKALQMKIEKVDEATPHYQAGEWYGFADIQVK